MVRIFFFVIGFILMVYGISVVILYLNLITIGYNLSDYVNFIIGKYEFYFIIIGLVIVILTMVRKGTLR